MDISPPFVTDGQAAEMTKPCKGPLDNPSVLSEPVIRFHAATGNPREHSPLAAGFPAPFEIVGLVRMQFPGPASWSATPVPNAWHGIQDLLERHGIVLVRWPHQDAQRYAVGVRHQVVLGSVLPTVRRVRPNHFAPLFARMLEASTAARSQSIFPASFKASSKVRCSWSHTPSACHSLNLRQQVIQLPHPISFGRSAQRMPVFSTNRIPRNAALSAMRGRPPSGFDGGTGSRGAMRSQRAEGRISLAIQLHYAPQVHSTRGFVTTSK